MPPEKNRYISSIKIINGLSVFIFLLFVISQPNFVTDIWWQLRLGDQIRLTHLIPTQDEYSWTCFHRRIVLHEWGSYLAFAEAYRHLGAWSGIWILEAVLVTAILVGLYCLILRRIPDNPFVALLLTILAGHMCGKFLAPRPQLFTYVCLLLSLEILFYCQARKVTAWAIFLLACVQIFWANTHAAGPLYIVVCMTYAAGSALQGWLHSRNDSTLAKCSFHVSIVSCVCALVAAMAMVVNPFGFGIFAIIFATVGNKTMPSAIGEWTAPDFHSTYGGQIEFLLFFIGFVLASTKKRKDMGDIFVISLLSVSALYALRNVPILALVGLLILAPYVPSAFQNILDRYPKVTILRTFFYNPSPQFGLIGAVLSMAVLALAFGGTVATNASSKDKPFEAFAEAAFDVHNVPEDGCQFMEKENIPTSLHLYNDYDNGAYLIWRLPQYRIFSSTETFVYFGPVLETYFKLEGLPLNWRSVIAPYNPDLVLMTTTDRQLHLFLNAPEWAMVYAANRPADNPEHPITFIFVRRLPSNATLIQRCRHDCPEVKSLAALGYPSAE